MNESRCCAWASRMQWKASLLLALFWTTAKSCGPAEFECFDAKCVKDESLCNPAIYGAACPPQTQLICRNVSLCYPEELHCDGKLDCPGGSDEAWCTQRVCAAGDESCAPSPCVRGSGQRCCRADDAECAANSSEFPLMSKMIKHRIIFADRRNIYSLSMNRGSPEHFAGSDCCNVTSLSYSVAERKVFWTAGQYVWEKGLDDQSKEHVGVLNMGCSISDMAYDWITGNFYIVCKNERVMVCNLRRFTKLMLCADLTSVSALNITSIALRADSGTIYLASPSSPIFQIYQVSTDGSSLKQIFDSENFTIENREVREFETGAVYEFSWEFVEELLGSDRRALKTSQNGGNSLMRFLGNGSQLRLPLNGTQAGPIVTVFDEDRQPLINHCGSMRCDHLCVVVSEATVCMCDSHYKLMQDNRTCCKKNDEDCMARDYSDAKLTASCLSRATTTREPPAILLVHAAYLAAVLCSWVTGIACFFLGRQCRSSRERNSSGEKEPTPLELDEIMDTAPLYSTLPLHEQKNGERISIRGPPNGLHTRTCGPGMEPGERLHIAS